ncbi:hypothetical protein IDJ75_09395 [Mucilaginibacter rigui]|uniref:Uncharacterized protein n=1 Tax=Mucilaginibacter rigui TaxID=534635 RepID=A0ABR7X4I1_9SPHI|nr:hypothetical protein [Mucilaginibacter rigui]MBD1385489.1 hypothetical protein [Mucilaginibacter rigui]
MNTPDSSNPGNNLSSVGQPNDPIVNAEEQYVITNNDDAEKVTNKDSTVSDAEKVTEKASESEKVAPQPPPENL